MIDPNNPQITLAKYSVSIGNTEADSIFVMHNGQSISVPINNSNNDYRTLMQLVADGDLSIEDAE